MIIKDKIGQRILMLRKDKGLSRQELANLTEDVKPSSINNWERGDRTPGPEAIRQLSKAFDVSIEFLLCLTDDKHSNKPKKIPGLGALIPILNYKQACDPVVFIETIKIDANTSEVDFLPISAQLANQAGHNAFAMIVNDESMKPTLLPNDILIVSVNNKPKPGGFVVAKLDDHKEVIVRQYKQLTISDEFQEYELLSVNENWGNIHVTNKLKCEIEGVVVAYLRIC
ncbi:TPA: LexA family transcriptional regulator [Legionella pneumophila]|nr:XRE family transcriptional regulator [Legionella pneumophila]HAT4425273.1 LexA family transcriptional regulator [Legionella pneumophila]HAU1721796.1 LexA family transcriptional regulator [Legionella pneumophila]